MTTALLKKAVFLLLVLHFPTAAAKTVAELEKEVFAVETAFAQTMVDRDFAAFQSFLADETVFLAGKNAARGKAAVSERWKRYYKGDAPFSWKPETVVVLESGKTALSTGPVSGDNGIFAYYTSIWRLEDDGNWRIILDKGNKACPDTE